jgi:hypothetical protein
VFKTKLVSATAACRPYSLVDIVVLCCLTSACCHNSHNRRCKPLIVRCCCTLTDTVGVLPITITHMSLIILLLRVHCVQATRGQMVTRARQERLVPRERLVMLAPQDPSAQLVSLTQ